MRLVIVDVWGGPDSPGELFRARWVRPMDEALEKVRSEAEAGYIVNVACLPADRVAPREHDTRQPARERVLS